MTSNALTVYQKVDNPIAFCDSMAKPIAATVGCNPDQGTAIALTCLCEGLTPLEFVRRYHWIPGKGPSMRADSMLSEFRLNKGGKYKVVEKSSRRAAIEFTDVDGNFYACDLTLRRALLSRWPWAKIDKAAKTIGWLAANIKVGELYAANVGEDEIFRTMQPHFKDNWGTEFDWANMLLARLISESLRYIQPELVAGVYTPEEMEDVEIEGTVIATNKTAKTPTAAELMATANGNGNGHANGNGSSNGNGHAAPVNRVADIQPTAEPAPFDTSSIPMAANVGEVFDDANVQDAEFVPSESQVPPEEEGGATRGQLLRLTALRSETNMPLENWEEALAARGVKTARGLSVQQAQDLIDKIEAYKQQLIMSGN